MNERKEERKKLTSRKKQRSACGIHWVPSRPPYPEDIDAPGNGSRADIYLMLLRAHPWPCSASLDPQLSLVSWTTIAMPVL